VLSECGDSGVKLNEISQRLYVTPANLTGLLDRMEEAGWLRRTGHPEDRRVTLAVLTRDGKNLFQQTYPDHTARIKHVMSGLTSQEQRTLAELLTQLSDRVTEATDQRR
jgi:MarR family 2-MHQ and catechol resistance regulon transcriptional repressor